MRICTARLVSVTPYSQSKMLDKEVLPMREKEKADAYDMRLWREKATYNEDGYICIPAMALKMTVDEAVKRLALPVGRGKTLYTKYFLAGQLCEGDVVLSVTKDEVDSIDVWANSDGVRGSGKRVKRRFPYIPQWEGEARFAILDEIIPNAIFERALTEAGRLVGIGRFRPERGGFLGRFRVERIQWIEI